tara:strand:+ start:3057 stop:3668 length:612 start_codon:yes stop_codon:yes gene_type:complete
MKSITIKGSKRESVGKVATKALRNADKVPCVLYGGENAIHFSAEEKAFKNLVYTPNVYTATIELEGEKAVSCILKDIQFHPVSDRITHIDFYQLSDDKEVTMEIPVNLIGSSPGVMIGGSLRFPNRKLKVKALPGNLPDSIDADISKLEIGDKLFVSEVEAKNCTILHPENTVVAQVRMSRAAVAPVEGEGGEEEVAEEAAAE